MKLFKIIPMVLYAVFCFLAISKDTVFDRTGYVQNESASSDATPNNGDGTGGGGPPVEY